MPACRLSLERSKVTRCNLSYACYDGDDDNEDDRGDGDDGGDDGDEDGRRMTTTTMTTMITTTCSTSPTLLTETKTTTATAARTTTTTIATTTTPTRATRTPTWPRTNDTNDDDAADDDDDNTVFPLSSAINRGYTGAGREGAARFVCPSVCCQFVMNVKTSSIRILTMICVRLKRVYMFFLTSF
jgi:hypothetical protein